MVWSVLAVVAASTGASRPRASGLAVAFATALVLATFATRRRGLGRWAAVIAVVLALGSTAGVRTVRITTGPLAELAAGGGAVGFEAVVVSEPRVDEHGWWALLRVTRLAEIDTRERAFVRGEADPPALGSSWRGTASARPLEDTPFDRYLRSLHVGVRLDPRSWSEVAAPGAVARSTEAVRASVRHAASRWLPPAAAGLATGLVTGDTRLMPAPDAQAMQDTGLSHLTAVSGSNVAIVVLGTVIISHSLRLGARGRRRLVAATLVWFALLTRLDPSVLRAAVVAGLVLLAQAVGRRTEPAYVLAAALLLLVVIDPFLARSLGLLLSAAAAGGVLLLAPQVRRRLGWLPGRAGDLAAVTLGAQIAVAPLLLIHTDGVPVVSIPANLIAVPAAAVASALAIASAPLAVVDERLAAPGLLLARPALGVVLAVARALAGRGLLVSASAPAALMTAVAVVAWLVAQPRSRLAHRAALAGVVVLCWSVLPLPAKPVTDLRVTAIDVGQGDAILVEAPGTAILVDAGPDTVAAAWLRRHRPAPLDLFVVSHPHLDHIGGADEVIETIGARTVWLRPVPVEHDLAAEVASTAAARGIPVVEPRADQRVRVGDVLVEVLAPPPGRPYRAADSEPNEMSIVMRVSWRGRAVLLTGDAEQDAQRDLSARPDRLRAGLLKVPHHGGTTSSPAFLTATDARLAIISAGSDNRYGHPHPELLALLESAGMQVRRTDLEGTIRAVVPPLGDEAADPRDGPRAAVGSAHVRPRPAVPHRRRRRPPPPTRHRPGHHGPAGGGAGPRRGPSRRGRDPPPARPAHGIALRRDPLHRPARHRGRIGRPQG